MTDFGIWLGRENGKTMLTELLMTVMSKKQLRSVVTTYCLLFDVYVDTSEWDNLINEIYYNYNQWFDDKDVMDMYLCVDLV